MALVDLICPGGPERCHIPPPRQAAQWGAVWHQGPAAVAWSTCVSCLCTMFE